MVCKRCGICCKIRTDVIKKTDIRRWRKQGRDDILKRVRRIDDNHAEFIGNICPFYSGRCLIEDTKPIICKRFPTSDVHADKFTDGKCTFFVTKRPE